MKEREGERESVCARVCECVFVCAKERKRECVYGRERETMHEKEYVQEKERERVRERQQSRLKICHIF